MTELTGHRLTLARQAQGMTRADLARAIRATALRRGLRSGADRHRIRKWEVNGVVPDAHSQSYLAEVLGIPQEGVDARPWPHWLPCGVIPLTPFSTVPAIREALTVDRRALLLAVPGAALTALAADWAHADTHPLAPASAGRPVGGELVDFLEDTASRLTTLVAEQRQHAAAPLLDAHLATVSDLIAHGRYTRPLGLRLHTLAAGLCQSAGWHRFDLGRHQDATAYWTAGLHSAHAAGDRDLGAAALGDLAYGAAWRGDHTTAAAILHHALTRADHPAARALLHLRRARALAAQGEKKETMRHLAAAEQQFGAAATRQRPAFCTWLSDADLAVDSGQALGDLGDPGAHRLIREGQDLLPAARAKTRGVFLAYQAASHLDRREPERAAVAAREALTLAQAIGAPRCVQLVQDLTPRFTTYATGEGVLELLTLARAA
ncbi:XRE family transcriptional regulator [Streptomyces sp. NPDC059816]|uniref:helix-turn-helix domain-containing protein n=1 Tax=Streptomyces sp. NPDC059816 TaxID=3346960 RepID=UPI0036576792